MENKNTTNWNFSCELQSEILLPPKYSFPQALNYLNPANNSFYILQNENGFVQCAGSKTNCTVEYRSFSKNDDFKHYVFYNPNESTEKMFFKMSEKGVYREKRHSFNFLKAAKLFLCYFENRNWPEEIKLEDITSEFK